jgi:hypothetical protein
LGLLVIAGIVLLFVIAPTVGRLQARAEAIRLLKNAKTVDEAEAVVGRLGLCSRFPDGSWRAIRYRDSHAWPGWSVAIARDSEGRLFASSYHFCGRFYFRRDSETKRDECIRELAEQGKDTTPAMTMYRSDEEIDALAEAPDLAAARQALEQTGFRPIR